MQQKIFLLALCLASLQPLAAAEDNVPEDEKLTGTPIGSTYSYYNGSTSTTVNTKAAAFDGDASTYFAAWEQSMGWVGLDLSTPHVISRIVFRPRNTSDGPSKMLLGVFEGANSEDFMDAVPLHLISETPSAGSATTFDVQVTRGFRYVRYVGPSGSRSVVAELEFYGHEGEGSDSIFYQVTELPTVSIHVKNNSVPQTKGVDFTSNLTIVYEGGTLIQEYPILTRVRGNFSATHENKPYRIKFDDGKKHHMLKGSAEDESPAKAKKWLLINNYGDKTLIRNNVAFEVSRRVGMPFTPWCRCVDLLLNGEYRGCYQLTDHVSSNPDRIPITDMEPEDIEGEALTGGYLIEMNGYANNDPVHFTSPQGNPISVHEPDEDAIQPAQVQYIRDHFNRMEEAVFSADYTDPEKGYRPLLDLDTFLKYFLANEFSGNTDMLWQVFMYKERGDDHIYTGPVWDNDLALENDGNVYPGNEREDWTYTVRTAGRWSTFVSRILSDPSAMARLQTLWAEARDREDFTEEGIRQYIETLRRKVSASARLNHIRWPYLLQKVHCNPEVWGSWDAEVDVMRDYAVGRVAWMDNKLNYNKLDMVDGVYQINNPLEMTNFAAIVNNGRTDIDAVLNADIDMRDYESRFTPIGSTLRPFKGRFDGGRHLVKNLHVSGSRYLGLFGVLGDGASVSDITLDSTCAFEGNDYVGGIVGRVQRGTATISRCGNEASVTATGLRAGGLVGGVYSATLNLDNSYNAGSVTASNEAAAIVGWASGAVNISRVYNTGKVQGQSGDNNFAAGSPLTMEQCYDVAAGQAMPLTQEQLASGQLAWTLNHGQKPAPWRQNLDNGSVPDTHPTLLAGSGPVFRDGSLYTNINPDGYPYRYYLFVITDFWGNGVLQFSEFDLLDDVRQEIAALTVLEGTPSSIQHENWPNVADNNTGSKYCGYLNGRVYFIFDAQREIQIQGYRIYTANDTREFPDRNPCSWKLYATNTLTTDPDDSVWQLIDERENDQTLGATNYTPYDFSITWPERPEGIQMAQTAVGTPSRGVYDLSGRRLADSLHPGLRLTPGLYIVNGVKVHVK